MRFLRFIYRSVRAVLAFAEAGIESARYARTHPDADDVSYHYSSRLARGFERTLGLRYVIRNSERLLDSQPCVYFANHRSNLDVVTLIAAFPPRTVVIGKIEVTRVPWFGTIFVKGKNIAIDRKDHSDSMAGMAKAERAITDQRLSVFVFPEGTRNFGKMRKFKKGGFHLARNTGRPIVPLVCAVPKGWVSPRRMRKQTDVLIDVLEPIDPNSFASLEELMDHTRAVMGSALEALETEIEVQGLSQNE